MPLSNVDKMPIINKLKIKIGSQMALPQVDLQLKAQETVSQDAHIAFIEMALGTATVGRFDAKPQWLPVFGAEAP